MIYLSYKQTGIDPKQLEKELKFIKNKLEAAGHKVFIYYFEENSQLPPNELNKKFLQNIQRSEIVLAYINYPEKSEWQLLELGMAYALKKKIIILVNRKVKENYYLVYWLGKVIEFDVLENVDFGFLK